MLGINNKKQVSVAEKVSSGYRINRAADDAAGLSISEKMRRQIRGLTQASFNAQDGISMVQLADGAMDEVHQMLQRGNELCIQAATGTLSEEDREYIQMEIEHLKLEIDGLSERTEFNKIQVLRGKGEVPVTISPGNAIVKGGFPGWAAITGGDNNYMNGTYTTKETFKYSDNTTEEFDIKHVATKIDFSKYTVPSSNPDYKAELMGQGFYTTCCTCSNHYSIEFTAGTGYSVEQSGQNYIYKIGLDGINDGETLIDTIVSALGNNGTPLNHYTSFVKENNTTLVVYDNRGMESKRQNFKVCQVVGKIGDIRSLM